MFKMTATWWRALFFGFLFILGYKIIDNFPRLLGYLFKIVDVLTPFIIGGVIAFFLHKPVEKLDNLIQKSKISVLQRFSQSLSIIAVYFAFLFVCIFFIGNLVDALYQNIAEIIGNWDQISTRFMEFFEDVNLPQKQEWLDKANRFLTNLLETEVLLKAGNIVGNVANLLLSIFTGLIISVYTIVEKDSLKSMARSFLRLVARPSKISRINRYIRRLIDIFYSYFTGLALDATLIAVISAIFYSIADAPFPWLLGVVAGIGNLIPFFGPIVAAVIITLVCAIALGPTTALWFLVFQLVLGQIDGNIIQPRIVGNSVGISPFWVIFAVVFFGGIWGTWGMLLGVPIVATVRMIVMNPPEPATPQTDEAEIEST